MSLVGRGRRGATDYATTLFNNANQAVDDKKPMAGSPGWGGSGSVSNYAKEQAEKYKKRYDQINPNSPANTRSSGDYYNQGTVAPPQGTPTNPVNTGMSGYGENTVTPENYNDPHGMFGITQNRLNRVDPRTTADRLSAGRRDSARQYQAKLQAREASAKQGYGAGTAQASRLQKEAMSPVLKAGVAEQANISDQQRKYYEGALKDAWDQTLNAQTRHDVNLTQTWQRETMDDTKAQQYLNSIKDPVLKMQMSGIFAQGGLDGLREAMGEFSNNPEDKRWKRLDSPAMLEWKSLEDEIMQSPEDPRTGKAWANEDEKQAYVGEMWTNFLQNKYSVFEEGGRTYTQQQAVQRIKDNPANPTTKDVISAYDPISLSTLGSYDGGSGDGDQPTSALIAQQDGHGWINLDNRAVRVTGSKDDGKSAWIELQVDGKKWLYSHQYEAWMESENWRKDGEEDYVLRSKPWESPVKWYGEDDKEDDVPESSSAWYS